MKMKGRQQTANVLCVCLLFHVVDVVYDMGFDPKHTLKGVVGSPIFEVCA
jgi:hypothetical protein